MAIDYSSVSLRVSALSLDKKVPSPPQALPPTTPVVEVVGSDGCVLGHSELRSCVEVEVVVVEVLLYVHRNRRFIRDGSPGRPSRLSHSS